MSLLDLDIMDLSSDDLVRLADSPLAEELAKTDSESKYKSFQAVY
jgi:hypothetical protein